jgi:hypothetical protein
MMSLRINAVVAAIARMPWQLFAALYLVPDRLLHVLLRLLLLLLLVALGCLPVVLLLLPMLVGSLTWLLLSTALHLVLSDRLPLALLCICLLVLGLDR